jgi:lysine 6-dehydrogenase
MRVAVLGAGMVGSAIAIDLAEDFVVTSFDVSETNLLKLQKRNRAIQLQQSDLQNYSQYAEWLREFDIVVTAVPGSMGFNTLLAVIKAGKNVADITAVRCLGQRKKCNRDYRYWCGARYEQLNIGSLQRRNDRFKF